MTMPLVSRDMVLESGMEFQAYQERQRAYRRALVKKWKWLLEDHGGKLRPIPPMYEEAMAMLLENQQAASMPGLLEATTTGDLTLPQKFTLPLVRNIFPNLLAMKMCSIQPLPLESGGVGRIFYQDFETEDTGYGGAPVRGRVLSTGAADSDYARGAEDSIPRRIKMTITSDTITVFKDILGASWSTEVMEDARGALGLDVEAELVEQMRMEIQRELDARILDDILTQATAGDTTWHYTVGSGYTVQQWYETLGHALLDAEMLIWKKRFRKADYIVAGTTLASYISKMQNFVTSGRGALDQFSTGTMRIGTYNGTWDVYTCAGLSATRGIMGYYPSSITDAGYIFAPYIPMAPMPLVYAEFVGINGATLPGAYLNTDKWSRNIRTRNGKKMVQANAFATLTVAS